MKTINCPRKISTIVLSLFLLILAQFARAQESEPLFEQLTKIFKKEYLSIGLLLQTVGDFQPERSFRGQNGFSIGNFRLSLSGELDRGFGYYVQTDFVSSPTVLDARMYFRMSQSTTIDIGQFKSPFSKELLTSAAAIDFVNRSQVVNTLAPSRQIGLQVRGWMRENFISFAAGVFNGNGLTGNNNDNNHLLYAGRLTFFSSSQNPEDNLQIGVNIALSEDDNFTLTDLDSDFSGSRFLFGGDFRWTHERLLLSSEAIFSRLNPDVGPNTTPYGLHATAGYMLTGESQILLRWDAFHPDGLQPDSHLIVFGYNLWPTKATEVQINYIIPTEGDFENQQLLFNVQMAF